MNIATGLISESLLGSSDALNVLFETSPDCVKLITIDGRLARMNHSGLCSMEIADPALVVGAEWASLWPPGQQEKVREAVTQAAAGVVTKFDGYCPTAGGAPKWWDVTVAPVRDADGTPICILSTSRDVSEAVATRPALITLGDGAVISGWNLRAQAMFGWSAEEAIGRKIDIVVPERTRGSARDWSELVIATGEDEELGLPIQILALRRTGEEFPIECVVRAVPTGDGWALVASIQDISNNNSKQQIELFENAFQSAPIGKALVSLEGRFLKLNRAFCALVAFDEATLLATDFQTITHPDDLDADLSNLNQLVAGEIPGYEMDKRYVRSDGSLIWVNLSVSLVRFPDGRPKFFIAQVQDLTARRAAESRYRLLAENASDVVAILDDDHRCLYVSPACERMFGYTQDEIVSEACPTLVPEHLLPIHFAQLSQLAKVPPGETVTLQSPFHRKDGATIWVEMACRRATDDDGRAITVALTRDISDRLETERRYRLLADNMADILVHRDLNGGPTFTVGACESILGWSVDEIHQQGGGSLVHPDDEERAFGVYPRVLGGETGIHSRYRLRCKDGSWRWLESRPKLLIEDDGRSAIVDTIRDMTEQVEQEQALTEARRAAETAAAAKSEFLANMSHEIRTPLTAIIGFTGLLSARPDLHDAARVHVERVESAGKSLLAIVNDVLDFSKLEAGQFDIKPQVVSPLDEVQSAVLMFGPQADAKGVALDFLTEGEIPAHTRLDPDRLRQILLNLISNAMKFTAEGHVRLSMRFDAAAQRLQVEVEDTGPGMDARQQAKLFQRFSQVDASSTRRYGGTGLGLAICKGLAEAMGGGISAESTLGAGSVFTFNISAPVVEVGEIETDEAQRTYLPDATGLRVLVVDDNPVNRELARTVLEMVGAEVFEAGDGREALCACEDMPYDVMLLDVRMPGMDGPAVLSALRSADGPNSFIPVLAFTADADPAHLATGQGGFDDIVRKPIEAENLIRTVVRWSGMDEPVEPLEAQYGV